MANKYPNPPGLDKLVSGLYNNKLIKSHVARGCNRTSRGNPNKAWVNYNGNGGIGDQELLDAHFGKRGRYKVYVVPVNLQKLKEYIAEHYS